MDDRSWRRLVMVGCVVLTVVSIWQASWLIQEIELLADAIAEVVYDLGSAFSTFLRTWGAPSDP